MLDADGWLLIDKGPNRQAGATVFFLYFCLSTDLFSFYQSMSAAEIGPSVLDSGDTEGMNVQPVKGKSFISVDPLGQVD